MGEHTPDRAMERKHAARTLVFVGVFVLALAALSVPLACLPDLGAARAGEDGSIPTTTACGDGIIATLDDGGDAGESCDPGDAAGCEGCQIKCEGRLDPASGHCYFVAGVRSKYSDAVVACSPTNAHVVTVDSQGEAKLVDDLAADAGYWIGLDYQSGAGGYRTPDGVNEPGWPTASSNPNTCSGCFGFGLDGGGFLSAPGVDAGPACVAASGGSWFSVPCTDTASRTTICEREPAGQRGYYCGGPTCFTLPATAGQKVYVLFTSATPADAALAACREYQNGNLVMFDSREEREQLARELRAELSDVLRTYWIGLAPVAGGYAWDDQSTTRIMPWGDNQPSASTVGRAFLRFTENYDTALVATDDPPNAAEPRPFVCQRAP